MAIQLQRVLDAQGFALLYCYSPAWKEKYCAIDTTKARGLEAVLAKLQAGLSKPKGKENTQEVAKSLPANPEPRLPADD